jgi:hypothetical protein
MTLKVSLINSSCGIMFHCSCSKNDRDKEEEYSVKTSSTYIYAVLSYCNTRAKKVSIVEPEETAVARP